MAKEEACIPHLLMVPFPSQGHIIPMFKLAKLLHHGGFHITFLNSEFNHRRLLRSHGVNTLQGLIPNFDFATMPDGLPPSDDNATQDIHDIMRSVRTFMSNPFRDFVTGLSSNAPPPAAVTCIIVDAFMSFAFEVARQFLIPTVQFVILGAGPILPWYSTHDLVQNGFLPLKENTDDNGNPNGHLDTVINCIPGLEGIPLKYISDMLLVKDLGDLQFNHIIEVCKKSLTACSSAILFNTFDDMDPIPIKQLSSLYSTPVLGIGPIHLLEDKVMDNELYSFGANLWEEDASCLKWLDSKPHGSVLFVSFGSITFFSAQQMIELAWGLANSKHYFLWVIRPDLVRGNAESRILPLEFDVEIKDRGLLTKWCPQEKVLKHPAIGGFMTQCGWNSLLESLCVGLPVLCLPFFAEQVTNTWLCCKKWGIGLESDINSIKRGELEKVIKELMSGPKSEELKKNVMEWKKKAEVACESGSSVVNFEILVTLLKTFHTSSV